MKHLILLFLLFSSVAMAVHRTGRREPGPDYLTFLARTQCHDEGVTDERVVASVEKVLRAEWEADCIDQIPKDIENPSIYPYCPKYIYPGRESKNSTLARELGMFLVQYVAGKGLDHMGNFIRAEYNRVRAQDIRAMETRHYPGDPAPIHGPGANPNPSLPYGTEL